MHDFDVEALDNLESTRHERSQALLAAIKKSAHFHYNTLKTWTFPNSDEVDVIGVTLECDGVPDRNTYGIEYREQLGILVGPKHMIPLVWLLRSDFPSLIHMNDTEENMPLCPCLYFEDTRAINRSWTAERFLKRIYWWMENSAKGSIHHADQPVEQFFFEAFCELVLPPDIRANLEQLPESGVITRTIQRSNKTCTFFLQPGPTQNTSIDERPGFHARLMTLEIPPVEQGRIFHNPSNLAQLISILESTGLNARDTLKQKIQTLVGEDGMEKPGEIYRTIILVRIPIARSADIDPEDVQLKGFMMLESPIDIGLNEGFLLQTPGDNKVYRDLTGGMPAGSTISTFPVDILNLNSQADFAFQSGTEIGEIKYSLFGLGALGSTLADLWARNGWPAEVLVDKDHVKPHNLTRHTAENCHIGFNKAEVCANQVFCRTGSMTNATISTDNILDLSPETRQAMCQTQLIIDASTTLDYPRMGSFDDELPRHCSVFVTPSGKAGVMLFEDNGRKIRLRSLEAQYYRAIIENDWGDTHLTGSLGNFVSGAGCRDISLRLPYSSITGLASIFTEQVKRQAEDQDSCIKIWDRNPGSGETSLIELLPQSEISQQLGDFTVFYDTGLVCKLNGMRQSRLPTETGGILLGYYDFNLSALFIVDALPAPPNSEKTVAGFQRGDEDVLELVQAARKRTANIVDYIGEWHSHPEGATADPSSLDNIQLARLAEVLAEDGLPALQLIVGEDDLTISLGAARDG